MDEDLKRQAYLEGQKLQKAGYDAELILARLDKIGIPEDLAKQVVRNLFIQQTVDAEQQQTASLNVKLNTALIRIGIGLALAVVTYLIFPGIIIFPIGLVGGGVLAAVMARSKM